MDDIKELEKTINLNQPKEKPKQTYYDLLVTKLNNSINDLTTKYKEALITIQELQTENLDLQKQLETNHKE